MKVIIEEKAKKYIKEQGADSIKLWLDGCGS